jgi:hypothetical protein
MTIGPTAFGTLTATVVGRVSAATVGTVEGMVATGPFVAPFIGGVGGALGGLLHPTTIKLPATNNPAHTVETRIQGSSKEK